MKSFASPGPITLPLIRLWPKEHNSPHACHAAEAGPTFRQRVHRLALAPPGDAPARSTVPMGLLARLYFPRVGPGYGQAMAGLPHTARRPGAAAHALHNALQSLGHMGRGRGALAGVWGPWAASRGRATARSPRAPGRRTQHRGPKRGEGRGGSGDNPPQGATGIALIAHKGDV
jgi:hypothetical protein